MDSQLPSPNSPAPTEGTPGVTPEVVATGAPSPEAAPAAEQASGGVPAGAPAAPVLSAADVAAAIAATPTPGVPGTAPTMATPAQAADVDVIEPEWVDKAEQVIRSHQGDPYSEEEAIEQLQEDYLQKRYGINVTDPNADNTKPKGV